MIDKNNVTGILTFFQCCNYGAFLQAYALQRVLKHHGVITEFMNYRSLKSETNEYNALLQSEAGVRARLKIKLKMLTFRLSQRVLKRTHRLYTAQELERLHYPNIIIGSDQIWCYTREWGGFDPVYFSFGLNANRIISYAASMGPDNYNLDHPTELRHLMQRFAYVGVRDTNTLNFAKRFGAKAPHMVLDPTLLYDFEKECKLPKYKNYILFYSDGLEPSSDYINALKALSKKHRLPIISVGKAFSWTDENHIVVSPFRWIGYVRNARFVFTCMYHGILFSIKYQKNFAVFLNTFRMNKCMDILERCGLASRVVPHASALEDIFLNEVDYQPVAQFISAERKISETFLIRSVTDPAGDVSVL